MHALLGQPIFKRLFQQIGPPFGIPFLLLKLYYHRLEYVEKEGTFCHKKT